MINICHLGGGSGGKIRGRCSYDGHTQYSSCEQKSVRSPHNLRWCLLAVSMGLRLINLQHTPRYCLHSSTDRTPAVLEYSFTTTDSSNATTCSCRQKFMMSVTVWIG